MTTPHQQKMTGPMTYPARGTLNRFLFKTPLLWWRAGLGPLLGRWMLVLTTWGRKSGLPRHTMLSYTPMSGAIYVCPGWGERTDWRKNTLLNPHVTVQTGQETHYAIARRVTDPDEYTAVMRILLAGGGDTHFEPWLESLGIQRDLGDIVAKRNRVVVVALDPSDEPGPPPMEADLKWLWPVLVGAFTLGWLIGRSGRR